MAVVLLLANALPLRAAQDEPVTRIEVRASRISEAQAGAPSAFLTEIDVRQEARTVDTVTDLLSESVGVQVRRFGGPGSLGTVSIRGSSANQVRVYLDGIPLSRARNETVNLSDLPLDALDRIEVYRGTAPVTFGNVGVAGVVNLVTRSAGEDAPPAVTLGFGSFATRKLSVSDSARTAGGTDALGILSYDGGAGDFPFEERDPATGRPLDPPRRAKRENNEHDGVDALLKVGRDLAAPLRGELLSEIFWKRHGVPGFGGSQSLDASLERLRVLQSARLSAPGLLDGGLDLGGMLFASFERDEFEDPPGDGEVGQLPQDRSDTTVLAGLSTDGLLPALPAQIAGWFAEASYETFLNDMRLEGADDQPDARRWHVAFALQDQIEAWPPWLLLVPTARYEHFRDRGPTFGKTSLVEDIDSTDRDLFTASIGAQSQPRPWLTLKGNLARAERAPNFGELFGTQGSVVSNPNLEPETAINRDAGFLLEPPPPKFATRLGFEYAYFNNDVDDMIVFVPNSQFVVQPQNVGRARLRGHEASLRATLLDFIDLDANYTRLDAVNLTDSPSEHGRRLPGRPRDEAYLRVQFRHATARLFYELNLVAKNYLDRANLKPPVESRDLHALGFALLPRAGLEFTFEARNISDDQTSDVFGFPLPGRAFYGSVRVRL